MQQELIALEDLTASILAAEEWAPGYAKAPDQHARLIKQTARMQRQVLVYLRDLAKQAPKFINWYEYSSAVYEQQRRMGVKFSNVQAYDVRVIVNTDAVTDEDQQFIKVVFKSVAEAMALGAASMEYEFKMPIGLTSTSTIMQQLTTEQLANLVGMRVSKDGSIVPNPNPDYNIDETTRGRIAQSVKTSISLGEDHTQAVERLQEVIADPARADMIAQTETVRAYATGRAEYARQSGATGKFWTTNGATDFCATNASEGTIPVDQEFSSGHQNEPGHPHCRCQVVYVYGDLSN